MTYSRGFSCDTVCIGFLVATFNSLDVLASDVQNNFLEDPTKETILFYAGDVILLRKKSLLLLEHFMVSNIQICSSGTARLKP